MKTFLAVWLAILTMGSYPTFAHDGDLDLTFGRGGKVTTDFSGNADDAAALAIQSDGKIVVAGSSWGRTAGTTLAVLARYNTDGALDMTFGIGGRVSTRQSSFVANSYFVALAIQPDGKIVALGNGTSGFITRYNGNGALDTTFGNEGIVTGLRFGVALTIQSDGKIIVASGDDSFGSLVRYNSDGTL